MNTRKELNGGGPKSKKISISIPSNRQHFLQLAQKALEDNKKEFKKTTGMTLEEFLKKKSNEPYPGWAESGAPSSSNYIDTDPETGRATIIKRDIPSRIFYTDNFDKKMIDPNKIEQVSDLLNTLSPDDQNQLFEQKKTISEVRRRNGGKKTKKSKKGKNKKGTRKQNKKKSIKKRK
jgi:hypothetical protein